MLQKAGFRLRNRAGKRLLEQSHPDFTDVAFYAGRGGRPGDGGTGGRPQGGQPCNGGDGKPGTPGTVTDRHAFGAAQPGPVEPPADEFPKPPPPPPAEQQTETFQISRPPDQK
jgi:hypothetical protein